jgi:Rho termination factor, N-terminal domain
MQRGSRSSINYFLRRQLFLVRDMPFPKYMVVGSSFALGDLTMAKWSTKDQRQYEHIKESSLERGESEDTAQEIAARTVNKRRREEGRTPNKVTQGTGNPNLTLKERTVEELRNMASKLKIEGRSKMKKAELLSAISRKY